MRRFGNAAARPNKAITQAEATAQLVQALVMMPDAALASHDRFSLGRMFRVPTNEIDVYIRKEIKRRQDPSAVLS